MNMTKKTGISMGSRASESPQRAKRRRRKRQAEERAWAARSGPVIVKKLDQD